MPDIILGAFSRPLSTGMRKPLSHKTLTKIRACLVSFIKYARKSGVSTLLPEGLIYPKERPERAKVPASQIGSESAFFDPATIYRGKKSTDWYIHAYRFSVIVGLRPGELAHIQYKRDIKGRRCYLRGAISVHGDFTSGKNENAIRSFVLPDLAMQEVEAQLAMLKEAGVVSPFLFPGRDGEHLVYETYRAHWERYRDYHGLSPAPSMRCAILFLHSAKACRLSSSSSWPGTAKALRLSMYTAGSWRTNLSSYQR